MLRKSSGTVLSGALLFALASTASAHPGHGADGGSFQMTHYLTEPFHLGMLFLLATAVVGGWLVTKRRRAIRAE